MTQIVLLLALFQDPASSTSALRKPSEKAKVRDADVAVK